MQHAAIQHWLRRKAASEAASGVLFAAGCLVLGVVVLAITFLFTFAVVWFGFNVGVSGFSDLLLGQAFHFSPLWIVIVSFAFVALLFRANQRISRDYLATLPPRRHPGPGLGLSGFSGALISLLAYPGASTRTITDALLTGPRLVTIAWSNVAKAWRLRRLDVESCTRALAVLWRKGGRVPFEELTMLAELPNPQRVFPQLRDLDGVVFLSEEPAGLSLTSELRQELADALGQPVQVEHPVPLETKPINLPPGNVHDLLGVPSTASASEVEVAYRNWMTQSAFRRAALESASRKQAEEQMRAVNAAYEAFLATQKSGEQAKPKRGAATEDADKIEGVWESYKRLRQ